MNTYAEKTQENKSQSFSNTFSQKQNVGSSSFQFEDKRAKVVDQLKLREIVNNSLQVSQLRNFQNITNNDVQEDNTTFSQMAYSKPRKAIVQRQPTKDSKQQKTSNPTQKQTESEKKTSSLEQILIEIDKETKDNKTLEEAIKTNFDQLNKMFLEPPVPDNLDDNSKKLLLQLYMRSAKYAIEQYNKEIQERPSNKEQNKSLSSKLKRHLKRNSEEVEPEQMTTYFQTMKEDYDNYLKNTNNHPLSFQVLDFSDNKLKIAETIIETIQQHSQLEPLFTNRTWNLDLWETFFMTFSKTKIKEIIEALGVKYFLEYKENDFKLLTELKTKNKLNGVQLVKIREKMKGFQQYTDNENTRGTLVKLLLNDKVTQLEEALGAIKFFNQDEKLKMCDRLLKKMDNEKMLSRIKLANEPEVPKILYEKFITSNYDAFDGNFLTNILKSEKSKFEKESEFRHRINVIDGLIGIEDFSITVGNSTELNSNKTNSTTYERICNVIISEEKVNEFVIHYHPHAKKADVREPYASQRHIKPSRVSKSRIGWDDIGNKLQDILPKEH